MRRRKRYRVVLGALSGLGIAFLAVWASQKGYLPIHIGPPDTGTLERDAVADNAWDDSTNRKQSELVQVDPIIFQAQTEPPVESATASPTELTGIAGRPAVESWSEPQVPTPPARLPVDVASTPISPLPQQMSPIRTADASPLQPLGPIVQTSEERPVESGNEPMQPSSPPTRVASKPAPPQAPAVDLATIDGWIEAGDDLRAHRELSRIYWEQPGQRPEIEQRLAKLSKTIFFSPQPHYMDPYVIEPGDQMRLIARKYDVTWEYLAMLNRVEPQRIRSGQKLKVIRGPFAAYVDLGNRELTVHVQGYFVRRYPVGIGKDGSTPLGEFTVRDKLIDPVYYGPDGVIDNDDPQNPLGERWIDIGDGYGIHGTIDPKSIGKAESRGCIRMLNEDVAEVYNLLGVGSPVVIGR